MYGDFFGAKLISLKKVFISLKRCWFMGPWWVLAGSIVGLPALSLMIVYWFFRLRLAIAKKGWKYTSTVVALPWIIGLFSSVHVLLWELTVIQKGGTVDTTLMYTLAALWWIVLATMGTGMILDAVKKTRQSST